MADSENRINRYFKALGTRISTFRQEKDFSLEELGLRIGIDRANMQKIENGRPITLKTLLKLALVLERQPQEFFAIKFDLTTDELSGLSKSRQASKRAKSKKKKKS